MWEKTTQTKMKQTKKLTLLAICSALIALCQPASAQTFSFGVRDGVSLSWLVGIDNTTPMPGLYAGFTGDFRFNERWGVGLDVTLSEQGVYCNENGDGVTIGYSLDYLNIPLVAHYSIPFAGDGRFLKFSAGIQAGIFLNATYEYFAPSVVGDELVSGNGSLDYDSFHPYDLGATVGVEWGIGVWGMSIASVEVRYTLGITQTHNGIANTLNGYYYISVPDNRNSVLQIGTVFRF